MICSDCGRRHAPLTEIGFRFIKGKGYFPKSRHALRLRGYLYRSDQDFFCGNGICLKKPGRELSKEESFLARFVAERYVGEAPKVSSKGTEFSVGGFYRCRCLWEGHLLAYANEKGEGQFIGPKGDQPNNGRYNPHQGYCPQCGESFVGCINREAVK